MWIMDLQILIQDMVQVETVNKIRLSFKLNIKGGSYEKSNQH